LTPISMFFAQLKLLHHFGGLPAIGSGGVNELGRGS
jgi:hypothetical protein